MQSEELQQLTASQPLSLDEEYDMQKSWREDEDKCTFIILDKSIYESKNDEITSMIGDTNIFMTDKDNSIGEIEIMIAEKSALGKRFGWESVIIMMLYGIKFVNIKIFEAKISYSNVVSINMFKKLGFVEKSRSDMFEEITFHKIVTEDWVEWLDQQIRWEIENC
ncbi:alpha/beta-tubulin-N-acetyltransferase 9 isoform X5 [Vanessa atalanta]|nr:alpha/beta-tubulin-N-acetyltransferase 9 isoform X5 [Vanessa atalanta]XP_047542350.1 alpha/beta-tubulin-N-acetyltransferase 9 isoform X5 [Vanessa atalanta]XP_047542356.1 alpha/beta-tubulin-N-acetyltransferase 9 isoform X5 [Vanessa atalanta]